MKKLSFLKKAAFCLSGLLILSTCLPLSAHAEAMSGAKVNAPAPIDFNSYTTELKIDYSQPTQLPLTGLFTKSMGDGRKVSVYISENAPTRSRFTVIALPEQTDAYTFLKQQGWLTIADQNAEGLFVLEPGKGGWKSEASEHSYIQSAMQFLLAGKNDPGISVFSTFGTFYLAGYGGGCAPLESWAAENPIYVAGQAYVGGTSVGQSYLNKVGAETYNGESTGGYPEIQEPVFAQTLRQLGGDGTLMTRSQIPVPTWLAGYSQNSYSISYWKNANDVLSQPEGETYHQKVHSDALQTKFANQQILKDNPNAQYGLSVVRVSKSSDNLKAKDLYSFLSVYTRYVTTFAYSNHIDYRINYGNMLVNLQKQSASASAKKAETYINGSGQTGKYESWAQAETRVQAYGSKTSGVMIGGIFAHSDYNNDGKLDPRDYLIYIPDSAKTIWSAQGAPVVLVHPGNSQTANIFMDSTMWWQVADREGCIVAIVGEYYGSATGVTYPADMQNNAEFDYILQEIVRDTAQNRVKLDPSRMYAAGQSAGSVMSQTLAMTNPDLFAAVATTSAPPRSGVTQTGNMIPTYLIHGQTDLASILPDLWHNQSLQDWIQYFFKADGLQATLTSFNASDTIGRFHTYMWRNSQEIPLIQYGYTLARDHNNIPEETQMEWDYLKQFSFTKNKQGAVTARFYSQSGFFNPDSILIHKG